MGGGPPYSQKSSLNHTINYLKTITYNYFSPNTQSVARAGSIIQQSVPRRSLEQSHRDAPSCAHLRATWCIKTASQITTKFSKPIQRHACYKHTRSTHALYEQQVSL